MDEVLRFFRNNEIWIYVILLLGALIYLRRFATSWRDLRGSVFGLERDNAQGKLNHAAGVLVILLLLAIAEFAIVSFVVPASPQANALLTPTVDLFATPTVTLPAVLANPDDSDPAIVSTPVPTVDTLTVNCIPERVNIVSPEAGNSVSGDVVIMGSADIENFGFYKVEVTLANETNWRTIQAGEGVKVNDILVPRWDTISFPSGDYILQLVVTDNNGVPQPECRIPIRIFNP